MSRIEDLEQRLAADPNSKIFVQLAEEYRKAGLQADAVATCRDGLEKHPNYFSARVALGRALLESDGLEEARVEFEQVLKQVPDNLLALKFLGETYHGLGQLQEALAKYQLASTLSPEDADLVDRIGQVEAAIAAPPAPAQPASPPPAGREPPLTGGEDAAGPPPAGEQSLTPTIPPKRPASAFLIERQASEMGGPDLSEDVRSIQEELEEQPVTSIFKRQAREIMDLGSIPQPQPTKKEEEPLPPAPEVPGLPDDAVPEPTPLVETTSAPGGAPPGLEIEETPATPPTIVPQGAAPAEPPPASAKPEFGIPQAQEFAPPEPSRAEFGIPTEPQELAPPEEPGQPVLPVDDSSAASVVPAEPFQSVEPIETIESVEPMPLEPIPLQQATEPVEPVEPVQASGPVGFGATETPAPPVPSEPADVVEDDKPGLATETLAELYASQGHLDRALGVYRQLVATQPDNVELQGRMEELEMLVKASQEPEPVERGGGGAATGRADQDVNALQEAIRTLEGWLAAIGRS